METSHSLENAALGYEVVGEMLSIPLLHIYVDVEFNCRGMFNPASVFNLGKNIQEVEQQVPLFVQPMSDVALDERPDPCAWEFRLISGHRRYMAIDLWTNINHALCIVKHGLTPQQARALNFTENLKRKDLSIFEEARGIALSWPTESVKDIADFANESRRWVQVRRDLLILPDYVQRKVIAGILSEDDIELLASKDVEELEAAFQQTMLDKNKPKHLRRTRGKQRNRTRGVKEIGDFLNFLYTNQRLFGASEDALAAVASTLAWVRQGIDSREFLENRLDFVKDYVTINKDTDKIIGTTEED